MCGAVICVIHLEKRSTLVSSYLSITRGFAVLEEVGVSVATNTLSVFVCSTRLRWSHADNFGGSN